MSGFHELECIISGFGVKGVFFRLGDKFRGSNEFFSKIMRKMYRIGADVLPCPMDQ